VKAELLYKAKGCGQCMNTGYRGRLGVYEVMSVTRPLRDLVAKGEPAHVLRDAAMRQAGMVSLWDAGLSKFEQGLTSLEELESVVLLSLG
jgi:type IV pilus assembly protein PilB